MCLHWPATSHLCFCSVSACLASMIFVFSSHTGCHSMVIHDEIIDPCTGWERIDVEEVWYYSIGKAYYQTSDSEAGYQKLTQSTLRVFGFDPRCSTQTQGDLCKLGFSFYFARLWWKSLSLVFVSMSPLSHRAGRPDSSVLRCKYSQDGVQSWGIIVFWFIKCWLSRATCPLFVNGSVTCMNTFLGALGVVFFMCANMQYLYIVRSCFE